MDSSDEHFGFIPLAMFGFRDAANAARNGYEARRMTDYKSGKPGRPDRSVRVSFGNGLVDPGPAVVPSPYLAPDQRSVDRAARYRNRPDMPDGGPGRPGLVIEAAEFVQRRRSHDSKSRQRKAEAAARNMFA